MKKLKASLLSFMSFAIAFMCFATPISAQEDKGTDNPILPPVTENGGIQTRESDWPDYNYGNWKDIAAHPEKHTKVVKCIAGVADDLGINVTVSVILKQIAKGVAAKVFGITAVLQFTKCLLFG